MLGWIDRACALLLVVGGIGHGVVGTLMSSPLDQQITLWSFSGSIAIWAVAALNWLRAGRPGDRLLAAFALLGALAVIGLMAWLMPIAGMGADPRPWSFIVVCGLLSAFSLRDLVGGGRRGTPKTM